MSSPRTPSKGTVRDLNLSSMSNRGTSSPSSPLAPNNRTNRVSKHNGKHKSIPNQAHQDSGSSTRTDNILTPIVNLIITGTSGETRVFQAHAGQLCEKSPTLHNLLAAAADSGVSDLKYYANPVLFAIWIAWSYHGTLKYTPSSPSADSAFGLLLDLYLLGWKLKVKDFMDKVVEEICAYSARSNTCPMRTLSIESTRRLRLVCLSGSLWSSSGLWVWHTQIWIGRATAACHRGFSMTV
ncbi:hypothetical protein EJ05DRAFT_118698 [Pseudovirgaria hyperparasitica]|uniref:BTB domain-containing protein n=1 Tax=Pseudovirgaria hyperparasitica TaxID=470096 RepID=A0A6A6VWD2_9PEZI|nr:uncharacterized protein EJ05DRAFT_118698 [Pseudovirgaria hyperparasitica]KAF2754998.1 hypothetical protein EJ05DRAFT_118698 [Pseudovirgaria hyperparasitica]